MTLIQEKVRQAPSLLKESGIDCWITFTRESALCGDPTLVFLAPGAVTWHSAFIVSADGRTRAIVGLYDQKAIEDAGAYDQVVGYVEGIREPLQSCLKELNPARIAINYSEGSEIGDGLTHGMFLTLQSHLAEIGMADRLVSSEPIISALRGRKTTGEIRHIKAAIRETEEIFRKVARFIRPGKSEKNVADFMKNLVLKKKLELAWDESTCPSVFSGPETAGAHYNPTDRKVERGHVLNMDFGVKVNGYCSDLQRTFYILNKGETAPPPDVMKGFKTIVRSIEMSRRAMKPGVPGVEVDAIARKVITEAGYEAFPHALGHQVGRFAHDGTAILGPNWEKYAQKPFLPIEEGMVFTLEPRLTIPGRGVATIEDMVVVTKTGARWLDTPQKKILLVK